MNRGVLLCDECCSVHRSLGRHISQIKYLRDGNWIKSQLEMVRCLSSSGANAVWERTLLDPGSGLASTLSQAMKNSKKKPNPRDSLHPYKSDFIRFKYQSLAFITRPNEDGNSLSDQLHSSVRTPNLKISLRLLAAGADPNYIHPGNQSSCEFPFLTFFIPEKGNSPLHVAANSSQLLQIELLLVYGADPLVKDTRGNIPLDIAIMNNSTEIVERLRAAPYDLTDRLSSFALGLKGIHETGHHIVRPDPNDDSCECSMIRTVSNTVFEELSKDVLDEVDRRELNQAIASDLSIDKKLILPFLPVNNSFSSTRNQGRQKLATLNLSQLKSLVLDVLKESFRRIMRQPPQTNGHKKQQTVNDIKDSEPLYDCVPSSENSDEEDLNLSKLEKQWSQNSLRKKKDELSGEEYKNLHGKLMSSDHLVQELVSSNKDMRGEIGRLQTMVQKLIDENAQLRTIVITKSDLTAKRGSSPRASPPIVQPRKMTSPQPQSLMSTRHPLGKDESNLLMSSSWTSGSSSIHETVVRHGLPSREEVFQKTEIITKRIQGLLSLAQEGKTAS